MLGWWQSGFLSKNLRERQLSSFCKCDVDRKPFYTSIKVEGIKNSSGECMMDDPENHMLLCQLIPKLQYYDFSLAWINVFDLLKNVFLFYIRVKVYTMQ